MKPILAHGIALVGGAAVCAGLTWLVNTNATTRSDAPIASAMFGFFIAAMTIGPAVRGSFRSATDKRFPLSTRERWAWGAVGAALIIAFALVFPALYDRTR